MCNVNYPKFPCRICAKIIHDKDKAVQCDICEFWIHIKCNNLNYLDYRYLQNCDESWYCIECYSTIFPFNSLSSNKNKYYDIDEMHDIKILQKNKSLSLFHINAYSLNNNFDEPQHLLSSTKTAFDIIAVSETRITKQVSVLNNLNLIYKENELESTFIEIVNPKKLNIIVGVI